MPVRKLTVLHTVTQILVKFEEFFKLQQLKISIQSRSPDKHFKWEFITKKLKPNRREIKVEITSQIIAKCCNARLNKIASLRIFFDTVWIDK